MNKKDKNLPSYAEGIHLDRAVNKEFYWYVVGANSKVLCVSETYKRRQGAINGATAAAVVFCKNYDHASDTEPKIIDHTIPKPPTLWKSTDPKTSRRS